VERVQDSEWICKYEVRAKYYRKVESDWKSFGSGDLRLEQHKTESGKNRMVVRNSVGKVHLNLLIPKDMPLSKREQKDKKGQTKCFINLVAVKDAEKGAEQFMIQVRPPDLEKTYGVIESFVK